MKLEYIEHYLVQTVDFEGTVRWYTEVLGLTPGFTPNFGFPVQWMYIGDRDVVHITHGGDKVTQNRKNYLGQQSQAIRDSGVIDHVAFRSSGLRQFLAHLAKSGTEFQQRQVNAQGLYQLFLFDPNGVKVELNFALEEAQGIAAPVMASGFAFQRPSNVIR